MKTMFVPYEYTCCKYATCIVLLFKGSMISFYWYGTVPYKQ